ncbi:MAG: cytochrome c-type biogenesis protein CcmH [Nitrosospira sp.]|nr:cytochrome c-type biogenesis protein CcmH [Nitrosospira sp.]
MNLALPFALLKNSYPQKISDLRNTFAGKQLILLLAFVLLSPLSWAKEAAPVAEDPVLERRMIALSEDLRCLVCQNESLAGSRADFANDLRREIREQMQANKSDREIIDFLVARYGDFVLYRPPVKPATYLLWGGPFAFLLTGAGILFFYLKRRRKQVEEPPLTEEQHRHAEALLKEDKGNNA